MTAQDWATTDDVNGMLDAIRGKASDRKLLLFACGCCRLVEAKVPAAGYLANKLEADAGRSLSQEEKWSMLSVVSSALLGDVHPLVSRFLAGSDNEPWQLAKNVSKLIRMMTRATEPETEWSGYEFSVGRPLPGTSIDQTNVLREVVANPFLETSYDPRWRTETVLGIAASIDVASAWDRLPILADAMQDAGCEDPVILDHCRDARPIHRRGCWVLDGILDRA